MNSAFQDLPASQQKPSSAPNDRQQANQTTSSQDSDKIVLSDGTPVRLRFVRRVESSKTLAGEKLPLEVVEPVLAGKLIAISQHGYAEATVTMAQAPRDMARGGKLQLKIESVCLADGELVSMRATKDVKGAGAEPLVLAGAAGAVAGLAFWPVGPLGFLVYAKGKNATIPAGTEITAYTVGEFPLDPAKFPTTTATPRRSNEPK